MMTQGPVSAPNDVVSCLKGSSVDSLLAVRFEAQARHQPDALALTLEGVNLSYGTLDARANQLAAYLRELGIGPESLVGIHLDRSFELIIAIFAVLKAGGAYLPLDLVCPEDRLAFMLEDSQAKVVLTHSNLASRFASYSEKVVCLDREECKLSRYSPENIPLVTQPQHLAYVIYTSGSTGTPKGCLVTQQNVARLFTAIDPMFHFGSDDVWTLFHSSAFDFSVWEIFGPLVHGGRLVLVPYLTTRSASVFRELLIRERVTVLNQTPSAFRQLIQVDQALAPGDFALRYVILGGEALEFQSLRPWFERYGDKQPQILNGYGPTETTVFATFRPICNADLEAKSGSNIGSAIPDLQLYLVDPKGDRVALGETGEILIGGLGVTRGYLNRPDLNQERFIANPFHPEISPRLYRSGDLARFLANGELEYLGRIDHQVKIRGYRIELGEIESMLARHPAIKESVVLARDDSGSGPRLVAYLVTGPDAPPSVEALRTHLVQKLPEYMVPSAFVFLDSLPLTVNGKIDRKALPRPTSQPAASGQAYIAPRNPVEARLAGIWQEVLQCEMVGVHDDIFEIGGDSLLIFQIATRSGQNGLAVTLPQIFQLRTIEKLAEALKQAGNSALTKTSAPIARIARDSFRRPAANAVSTPVT